MSESCAMPGKTVEMGFGANIQIPKREVLKW